MPGQVQGQRQGGVPMREQHTEQAVQPGGEHGGEDAAHAEDGHAQEPEGLAVGHKVLPAKRHPQEEEVASLVAHLEQGAHGEQKVGRAMQGTGETDWEELMANML